MPRITRLLGRRAGPVGIALTALDVWRRLPPEQRRRIVQATRTHGPRLAGSLVRRGGRPPRPKP